ncbi:hypothetical protein ACLKA7_005207 [Drosophila subpalustris]
MASGRYDFIVDMYGRSLIIIVALKRENDIEMTPSELSATTTNELMDMDEGGLTKSEVEKMKIDWSALTE